MYLNYKECFDYLTCEISLLYRTQTEDDTNKQSELWRIRGKDSWLGRSVQKSFDRQGKFTGRVDGVDDHAEKEGHRVFHITYSDGDDEWIEVDELIDILFPTGISCVRYNNHGR